MDWWQHMLAWLGTMVWVFSVFYVASLGWHSAKPKWARTARETKIERVDHLHIGGDVEAEEPKP
jgi:hypothetical protein